ncbi:gamma-glutamylcyclotransferase [Haliangium sp.]|uniref:gamma-glutamylcyclotransferase n=1 Tax=Haliangium sp. TaxID=2663208 RepID=UPI003D0F0366
MSAGAERAARAADDQWVFGYGSLVWRPAFPYRERRPGFICGYARRFWQASTDHRGTPEAPGRVVTLIAAPGAVCWGTAYRVAADQVPQVLTQLDHREQDGYERVTTQVTLQERAGLDAAPTREYVDAVVYIAGIHNPSYLGPASLEEIAQIVRTRSGPSGTNREYVLRLAAALADMDADDEHVFELARRVES